jgi:hypothetical protein
MPKIYFYEKQMPKNISFLKPPMHLNLASLPDPDLLRQKIESCPHDGKGNFTA